MAIVLNDINVVARMINEKAMTGDYDQATISGYLLDYNEDKNAVASVIWSEKAAAIQATQFDFSTEGESYKKGQLVDNAMSLSRMYGSRRKPGTALWIKDPVETDSGLFGLDDDDFENILLEDE